MLGLWRELECVTDAAKELGYPWPEVKPEQLEVAANFIEGRDVFYSSAYCSALARFYVTLACL